MCVCVYVCGKQRVRELAGECVYASRYLFVFEYGVATTSRLLKIIGLFCKRALLKRQYSAKETCNFKKPTNRTHLIAQHRLCERKCARMCVRVWGEVSGRVGV